MAKTIIQTIGPLYGEVVNGTVFGRPNGSIFVPAVNTIKLFLSSEYIKNGAGAYSAYVYPCTSSGATVPNGVKVVAESQDTAAYMALQLADNSDFTSAQESIINAGIFNNTGFALIANGTLTIVNGTKYYARAVLYASAGVPVAVSDTVELTGVVV